MYISSREKERERRGESEREEKKGEKEREREKERPKEQQIETEIEGVGWRHKIKKKGEGHVKTERVWGNRVLGQRKERLLPRSCAGVHGVLCYTLGEPP